MLAQNGCLDSDCQQTAPLLYHVTGPDEIDNAILSARSSSNDGDFEFYNPKHVYGHILSYPFSFDELSARVPGLDLLSVEPQSAFTDDSATNVGITFASGGMCESSSATTLSLGASQEFSTSFEIEAGDAALETNFVKVTGSVDLKFTESTSMMTLSSQSLSLNESTGVTIVTPDGFPDPPNLQYEFTGFLYGRDAPDTLDGLQDDLRADIKDPTCSDDDGNPVQAPVTWGHLTAGFTVNLANAGSWWKSGPLHDDVDIGFLFPNRWSLASTALPRGTLNPPTSCVAESAAAGGFACMEPRFPLTNMDLWSDEYFQMRGLLIGRENTDGSGPSLTTVTEGQRVDLSVLVWNLSFYDMLRDGNGVQRPDPGSVYVRFYAQPFSTDLDPIGPSFQIGDDINLNQIPPFPNPTSTVTASTPTNHSTAKVTWNTCGHGGHFVFWAVTWVEDSSGLASELPGHGLESLPGSLTSIYDAPLETVVVENDLDYPLTTDCSSCTDGDCSQCPNCADVLVGIPSLPSNDPVCRAVFSNNVGYSHSLFYVEPDPTCGAVATNASSAFADVVDALGIVPDAPEGAPVMLAAATTKVSDTVVPGAAPWRAVSGPTVRKASPRTLIDPEGDVRIGNLRASPTEASVGERVILEADIVSEGGFRNGVDVFVFDEGAEGRGLIDHEIIPGLHTGEPVGIRVPFQTDVCGAHKLTLEADSGGVEETRSSVTVNIRCRKPVLRKAWGLATIPGSGETNGFFVIRAEFDLDSEVDLRVGRLSILDALDEEGNELLSTSNGQALAFVQIDGSENDARHRAVFKQKFEDTSVTAYLRVRHGRLSVVLKVQQADVDVPSRCGVKAPLLTRLTLDQGPQKDPLEIVIDRPWRCLGKRKGQPKVLLLTSARSHI